jgi:hypothetical protein
MKSLPIVLVPTGSTRQVEIVVVFFVQRRLPTENIGCMTMANNMVEVERHSLVYHPCGDPTKLILIGR